MKSVEQKETAFDSAVEVINEVKQKKVAIEKQVELLQIELKSPSFYFKMVELKKLLKRLPSEATVTHNHQILRADLEQLESILPAKFGISPF